MTDHRARPHLRLADEKTAAPIDSDEAANDELNEHWRAARGSYAEVVGAVGDYALRWLIVGAKGAPRGSLSRGNFRAMAKAARTVADHASALATHLDLAVEVFDRRNAR